MSLSAWAPDRAGELHTLLESALPPEGLTVDEILACCWDDDGSTVLGTASSDGAVAVALRPGPVGFVKAMAVAPDAQRSGLGRALLGAAESWAFDQGASQLFAGGSAPFYLWPGIDVRWTRALCLFESAGWSPVGAELNMSCATSFRCPVPEGVSVQRVLEDADVDAAVAFCSAEWPWWVAELQRGIDHGTSFVALVDDRVAGFACHSVNRAAWIGPMGTDPSLRHRRVGAALLSALCQDLRVAGYADAEIAWVGPVGFYARTAGAAVSRVFRTVSKRRP